MGKIGKLIVITGATASGKDTVEAKLLELHPSWKKIVTTTTRPLRQNEQNGREYNFTSPEIFQKMKADNKFLETVKYAGNYYGTTKSAFKPILEGQTCIWRIDASRAAKINKLKAEAIKNNTTVIYLDIPDKETLYKRLHRRNFDEAEIKARIKQDEKNWQEGHFEHVIINFNGRLDETVQKILKIIS